MPISDTSERTQSLRAFLGVFILNLILAFPLFYTSYKQYDENVTPWDTRFYMAIADQGPANQEPPFRYRILTSLAVDAMRPLPGYDIPIDFTDDKEKKRDFFHFVILNGLLTVLTSALLFVWLRGKISAGYAWAGSILYLFSFYTVVCGFIPMADAGAHLCVLAGIMAFEARRPLAFALICLIVTFVREAGLLVLLIWVVIYSWHDRRRLVYLLWAAPALLAMYLAYRLFPGPLIYGYYKPTFMLSNVFAAFRPSAYGRTGLFHVVIAQLPLIVALGGWLWLRVRGEDRGRFADLGLFLVPVLWWMGMMMDIWTNTGRFILMAFPVTVLFEIRVIQAWVERMGVLKSRE